MRGLRGSIGALAIIGNLASGCDDGGQRPPEPPDAATACIYMGIAHPPGDLFPAGDGCNNCKCVQTGDELNLECTQLACCSQSDTCDATNMCGTTCCRIGELCVAGECRCGEGPGCGAGDTCAAAGPTTGCGSICCGASGPCPQ